MRQGVCALSIAALLTGAPVHAGGFVGAGAGIIHSDGAAIHGAIAVSDSIELHYSAWKDGSDEHGVGIAYRFANGSAVSVALGVAYLGNVTQNLLRHEDAYVEVRVELYRNVACQVSHYSTIGDDRGENFLLCGWRWGGRSASLFGD